MLQTAQPQECGTVLYSSAHMHTCQHNTHACMHASHIHAYKCSEPQAYGITRPPSAFGAAVHKLTLSQRVAGVCWSASLATGAGVQHCSPRCPLAEISAHIPNLPTQQGSCAGRHSKCTNSHSSRMNSSNTDPISQSHSC